jgi:phosphomevalonate kinase
MAGLGQWAGAGIVSEPHAELAALATSCGAAYKPSGAGGGDVGVAFARSRADLRRLARAAAARGYAALDLAIDPAGVAVRQEGA